MLSGESTGTGWPVFGARHSLMRVDTRRRDLVELAEDGAHGVDGVAAGDRERVGAVAALALPDAAGAALAAPAG